MFFLLTQVPGRSGIPAQNSQQPTLLANAKRLIPVRRLHTIRLLVPDTLVRPALSLTGANRCHRRT
jgi:hypothetical protein